MVELGAGLGALTRPLLASGASFVLAVERDRDLVPALGQSWRGDVEAGRLQILEADAKGVDFATVLAGRPKPHVIAGNLPYQITGPLLEKAVHSAPSIERAVFLVQLEVADRLAAAPGSDAYGALSVFAQRAFKVARAFVIRRGAFYPQPNVDSAVVTLEPLGSGPETDEFRAVVRGAFAQRRKTLKNAWTRVFGQRSVDLTAAAQRAGIDLSARGEDAVGGRLRAHGPGAQRVTRRRRAARAFGRFWRSVRFCRSAVSAARRATSSKPSSGSFSAARCKS